VDICLLSLIRMWWKVVVDDDRTAIQGRQRQREAILVKRICVFSLYPF
jgi:hypothetical protein